MPRVIAGYFSDEAGDLFANLLGALATIHGKRGGACHARLPYTPGCYAREGT